MQLIFISGSLRRSSRQVALLAGSRNTFTQTFVPFPLIDSSLGKFKFGKSSKTISFSNTSSVSFFDETFNFGETFSTPPSYVIPFLLTPLGAYNISATYPDNITEETFKVRFSGFMQLTTTKDVHIAWIAVWL